MIKRGPGNVPEMVEKCVHGGAGVIRMRALFEGEFKSDMQYLHDCRMEPGASVGMHPHKNTEEIYYVVAGEALVKMNGEEIEMKAGDALLSFKGSAHEFINVGDGECRVLVIPAFVRD